MKSKLGSGAGALAVVAFAFLLSGTSMYYPWAGQFPWDRPGTVNADVIGGALLSTSALWPAVTDYGLYRPTFAPGTVYDCRGGECRARKRW
jgi:hypothetical protein